VNYHPNLKRNNTSNYRCMKTHFKHINRCLKISIISIILCFSMSYQNSVLSQIIVDNYIDVGRNNISEGVYSEFSTTISKHFGIFNASTGALLSYSNANKNIFSAYSLSVSRDVLKIRKHTVNLNVIYVWKPFSEDLREYNVGVFAEYRTKHFCQTLGFNSQLYRFTHAAKVKYNFPDSINTIVWLPFNFMYKFSFYQPINKKLNMEVRVTNFDTYTILQDIYPVILTKFTYNLNSKVQLYSQLCYMQTGLMGIRVNYFGYYLRGGVLWQIK